MSSDSRSLKSFAVMPLRWVYFTREHHGPGWRNTPGPLEKVLAKKGSLLRPGGPRFGVRHVPDYPCRP